MRLHFSLQILCLLWLVFESLDVTSGFFTPLTRYSVSPTTNQQNSLYPRFQKSSKVCVAAPDKANVDVEAEQPAAEKNITKGEKEIKEETKSKKKEIKSKKETKETKPEKDETSREIKSKQVVPTTGANVSIGTSRFYALKDVMWIRDTLEDLTAAEFACTVEEEQIKSEENNKNSVMPSRRRAVDYDKLISQLNKRLRDIGCGEGNGDDGQFCVLEPGVGMGSIIYSDEERSELNMRLLTTREILLKIVKRSEVELESDDYELPFSIQLPELRVEPPKEESSSSPGPKVYVRDDGTVDWDGALQDRAALKKFGTAVWARINGQDPTSMDQDQTEETVPEEKFVIAKIEDTESIVAARNRRNELRAALREMEQEHTTLLNSAISAGQATANVNLAALSPSLRSSIRESAAALQLQKESVQFQNLVYELERIYTYLFAELGNPVVTGYVPLQDRLNVAEFGLLESQVITFANQLDQGERVDNDLLIVVQDQVIELKRKLGIDFYVTGFQFDVEGFKRFLKDLAVKTSSGVAFYVKGCRLLWNDVVFCFYLFGQAAQGYKLKPREVRNLRRTFKDIFTFIPFVIILLIPLTPIGHVLVFGAIQRFFPDFFPSCFTEQRQNLLQLYENAEYSAYTIDETFSEKVSRMSMAVAFLFTDAGKNLWMSIIGSGDNVESVGANNKNTKKAGETSEQ